MAIKDVPNAILMDWVKSQLTGDNDQPAAYLTMVMMTDAEKQASITTYLNARIANNNAQIAALPAAMQAQTDSLNADNLAASSAVTTVAQ